MIYVAFDEAHKERGNLSTNLKSLSSMLNENEFTCYPYAEFPIAKNNLAPYDILVLGCPDNAKFSKQERETAYGTRVSRSAERQTRGRKP